MRLLVDADLSPSLPAGLRLLRNVQASHAADHGMRRSADESIVQFAARQRMILLTKDEGISARRFPICTHPGIVVLDFPWRDSAAIVARLRLVWRSGLRAHLSHSITTIDDQGVKILGPDPAQRTATVFLVRPSWTARGARIEPLPSV